MEDYKEDCETECPNGSHSCPYCGEGCFCGCETNFEDKYCGNWDYLYEDEDYD